MPTSRNSWMKIIVEFSNLPNLWVTDFLERAQQGQLVREQQQLIALLLVSEAQLESFFGQIAMTLESDAREEFQVILDYGLGHIRTTLKSVKAARSPTKAIIQQVLEANRDCVSSAQAPKVPPPQAPKVSTTQANRRGSSQQTWDQIQEIKRRPPPPKGGGFVIATKVAVPAKAG